MNTSWLNTIYMYKMDCWKKLICIYKLFPFACCRSGLIFQFDRTFLKKKYHIHVLNCGPPMRVEKYIWNMIVIHPDFFRKSMSTITSIVRYLLLDTYCHFEDQNDSHVTLVEILKSFFSYLQICLKVILK